MKIERILIVFLLITTIVFGAMYVLRKPNVVDNKSEVDRLLKEIKDSEKNIQSLNRDLELLIKKDNKQLEIIDSLKNNIANDIEKSNKKTKELNDLRVKSKAYQAKIDSLQNMPPKNGDELINSLKNKFN